MWARSENLKTVNSEWHLFRINARRTAFSKEEFSESEQVEYDLDTADITGKDNPRSYTYDRPLNEPDGTPNNGTDVRTLDDR
jgi:hypothetical protein